MLEHKIRKSDLAALALLAVNLFLAASLLTYHPGDPPSSLVYPAQAETQNACGPLGAFFARVLLSAFGLGAYFLLISSSVLNALLLLRRPISEPLLRLGGWTITLVGFATLAALALPSLAPGPVIGPGGYLGAASRGLLESYFASAGACILALSLLVGGLLLCTDYVLLRLAAASLRLSTAGAARLAARRRASRDKPRRRRSRRAEPEEEEDEEEWEEEYEEEEEGEEDEAEVQVRIGRKKRGRQVEEEDDEEEEAAAEAAGKPGVGRRLADALRIKNRRTKQSEREAVMEQLEAANGDEEPLEYELPPIDLLRDTEPFSYEKQEAEVRKKAKLIEKSFASFGFNVRVVEIETGPVIAQYEVELEAGLRLSKITGLADDLAVALRVPSVRIVAPIPGKNTVGIEVPNADRQLVRLREVMEEADSQAAKMQIPVFLGKDVSGNPMVADLATLPHLLIAGRTGTGKSVCLNTIIMSMLMTRRPDEVKMLLVDPKMVELTPYSRLPHLMHPVVTDMKKAEAILAWAVEKMEERYSLLMRAGVRHMSVYNQLGEEELMERMQPETDEEREQIPTHLPYIVIVADEMADLMMTAPKEVEAHIIRLAQKSRAVGIHLVLATQKPTVDVITGLIKSNLPARIAFQVASRTDSRVVLDEMGADRLLGNGDMLFLWPGTSTLLRGQGGYVSDDELRGVVDFLAQTEPQFVTELVQLKPKAEGGPAGGAGGSRDDLYDAAVEIVISEGRGSVSLLQRSLGIGYGRAARLIDYMAEDGVVGPYNGSQAREVLLSLDEWHAAQGYEEEEPPPARPRRSNKVVMRPPQEAEEDDEPEVDELDDEWEDEDPDEAEEDEFEDDEDDVEAYDDGEYEEDDEEYEDEDEVSDEYQEDEYEDDDEEGYEAYEDDEYEEEEDEYSTGRA